MANMEMEALMLVNETIVGNSSHQSAVHHAVEGGFLSGRDPFEFNKAVPLPTFIVQLLIIICMSRIVKLILSPIKQPAVIAEIISGIILGPTGFGHIPHYTETIFPSESLPFLNLMSNFGLVLFLFLVGLELDPRMLKKSMKKSLAISLAGMALPFGAGVGCSFALYTYIEGPQHTTTFVKFFLFLGVAMAITAFPVLARILTELDLLKTKVGSITISAAAVDDATSWCLLALVISLINAGSGLTALYVFLIALAYTIFLIGIFRPFYVFILRRSGAFHNQPSQFVMFLTLCIVFISAFITDAIGIHAIFGGFLAGIIIPHEGGFAYHVTDKLEDIVSVIFLPLYFALSGLRTQIGSLDDPVSWGMVFLVIFVACFGKIVGCTLAAKLTKMSWRESLTVGALMNCKGLVELIVLNLGYDAHVINQKTFAIMVIMALVTTFLTVPLVTLIYPKKYHEKTEDELQMVAKGDSSEPSLLVSVNKIEQVPAILSIIHLLQSSNPKPAHINKSAPASRKASNQSLNNGSAGGSTNSLVLDIKDLVSKHVHGLHHHKKNKNGALVINSLRLIELTERDSSVVLQASQNVLSEDPVMKMFHTFCELEAHDVRSLAKVVTMSAFADTLVNTSIEVNAKYILVPWSGSGSLIEDTFSPVQQVFFENRRRQSIHTPVQHANFMSDLLAKANCPVLMLVDRGLEMSNRSNNNLRSTSIEEIVPTYQQIYCPFFGGESDREAVQLVARISAVTTVKIKVIRFKTFGTRRYSIESAEGSGEVIVSPPPAETVNPTDAADDELLNKLFGPDSRYREMLNLSYIEINTFTPITTAIEHLANMSSKDLVVVGRSLESGSNSKSGNVSYPDFRRSMRLGGGQNSDSERKKVLGDVAESILLSPCTSSMLIVQGKKKKSLRK